MRRILKENISEKIKTAAVLDFHTGLGPAGYGEPIYTGPDDDGFRRAVQWYGNDVTIAGEGASAKLTGTLSDAFLGVMPDLQVTQVSLEYGTRPIMEVLTALRGDHWLNAMANRKCGFQENIKIDIRNAFYVDTPSWKAAVYGRAADFILRACRQI